MTRAAVTRPDQGYRRDTPTRVAFAGLFGFGVVFALLGPLLPYLRQTEHISYLVGALHQVGYALGGMTAGLLATRSSAPRQRTIVIGLIGSALAGLLLGYGRILPITIGAAFLGNVFATAALIRLWALVADLHRGHRAVAMTEGEVTVSLAGVVTPAVVSGCASTVLGWRFSVVVAFVVVMACAAAVGVTRLPDAQRPPEPEPRARPDAGPRGGGPTQWRSLTTIFAIVALEFALSFWAASYLHDDVGIARDTSVALVSALYAANLMGRLVASRLVRRVPTAVLLRLSLATGLLGLPFLLGAGNLAVAIAGLAVTGMGIGGTFPLASSLHLAASHRTPDQALGQILTVAGVAQIVGPLAAGALAQVSDLRVGLLVLPALVLLAAVSTLSGRALSTVDGS
jgi:fucose permease